MSGRVLVLTAGFGEGHNAAARALVAGFDRVGGAGMATMHDAFALASPRFNRIARSFYLRLINHAPHVWSRVYDLIDRSPRVPRQHWLFGRPIDALAALIEREQPAAVCCTYPLYAFFLEHLARRREWSLPVFNIVTDSISIHSLWWRARCDGWFLPNEDSAEVLRRVGLPDSALDVSGFPVPAFFSENASRLSPPEPVPPGRPRVLHIVHSGTRHAAETARRLFVETDWEITCTVGRDVRLRARLERLAAGRPFPTRILGWTDEMPRLLMTHHVVVSKAGGATTQEAIAALCPMVVSQIVPGQEEGNYELLRRHGVGALAETPPAVLTALRAAFADDARRWRDWRAALRPLARPDAADHIARQVIARMETATTRRPGATCPSAFQPKSRFASS